MPEKVVIIGSGPAGWAAAIYAARASLEPLVYEGEALQEHYDRGRPPLGQLALTTEVENFPGFPFGHMQSYLESAISGDLQYMMTPDPGQEHKHAVTGPNLVLLMKQQALNFGTRIVSEDILDVDVAGPPFTLTASGGGKVETHALIIATGASANYLGLPSEGTFKNRGVSACAVCDGALPRFKNKPLIVVGGGDSAVEEADYLSKFASTVYLVHRRDELRASKIMAQRAADNPKIEIVWSHVVDEVLGNDKDGVTGARLKSTKDDSTRDIDAAGFFVAIGHTPNTAFLKGKLQTSDKGYLVWTRHFRTNTSVDGIFAAGDVADDYYRQAITAAGTGCMSALDAERWLAARGL
ncbi:MAG: FAD-dependent oxidoreductase [Planctomycetales bacterium]|nr:FAD-dependent oxidoreductase [Planctomycetales bacterium]